MISVHTFVGDKIKLVHHHRVMQCYASLVNDDAMLTAVSFSTESHSMAASYTSTFLPSMMQCYASSLVTNDIVCIVLELLLA